METETCPNCGAKMVKEESSEVLMTNPPIYQWRWWCGCGYVGEWQHRRGAGGGSDTPRRDWEQLNKPEPMIVISKADIERLLHRLPLVDVGILGNVKCIACGEELQRFNGIEWIKTNGHAEDCILGKIQKLLGDEQ